MTHDDAFLADIIANPDDDAPRLIYADWLEDDGRHERAEFIRVQCELARLTADGPLRQGLEARERQLLEEHGQRWVGRVGNWAVCRFRRGMMSVTINAHALLAISARPGEDDWFRRAMVLEMHVKEAGPFIHELAWSPHLARLASLALDGNGFDRNGLGDRHVAVRAGSPNLSALTALDLSRNAVGGGGVHALATTRNLPALTRLDLSNNDIDDSAVRTLAGSTGLARLEHLDVSDNPIVFTEDVADLLSSPRLPRLASVNLSGTILSEEGRRALQARFGKRVRFGTASSTQAGVRSFGHAPEPQQGTGLPLRPHSGSSESLGGTFRQSRGRRGTPLRPAASGPTLNPCLPVAGSSKMWGRRQRKTRGGVFEPTEVTKMNEEEGFLHAIKAAPRDDLSRLVYADWLEERGDPRADFVRLHLALMAAAPDHAEREAGEHELSSLRRSCDTAWLSVIESERPSLADDSPSRWWCWCFDRKGSLPYFHLETQDTECDPWKRLLDSVEEAAADGREEFAPLEGMSEAERSQILTLPPTIAKLKAVKTLDVTGSSLVRIPAEVGEMAGLEEFDPYSSYQLHWFPYEMTRCKNLKDSRVSTRALYGNWKYRPPFPRLDPGADIAPGRAEPDRLPLRRSGGTETRPCSVCGLPFEDRRLHRVWVSLRVATDTLPLLVNACSVECIGKLPTPHQDYVQTPHKGGLRVQQPPGQGL